MTVATKAVAADVGTFSARVFVIGGPPDADGDVIFDDNDGVTVLVSLDNHDTLFDRTLEPAGEATLRRTGDAVYAIGEVTDTARGHLLREKLLANGPAQEWSVGFRVIDSRPPSAKELEVFPDARRIIERWSVKEISPVHRGACGPSCRTTGAKCAAGGCACTPDVELLITINECIGRELAFAEQQKITKLIEAHEERSEAIGKGRREVQRVYVRDAELADRALEAAAADLGITGRGLALKYFRDDTDPGLSGFVYSSDPRTVWVCADRLGHALVATIGHEVCHAAQLIRGEPVDEGAARRYGRRLRGSEWGAWPKLREKWFDD